MKRRKCKAAAMGAGGASAGPSPAKLTRRTAFGYRSAHARESTVRIRGRPRADPDSQRHPVVSPPQRGLFPADVPAVAYFRIRYRRMVRDAAASHQMIGMVLLKEGWETDYEGAPPIFPTGALGRMVTVQALSDGRFNILLQGLSRFEIQEELGSESYRQGRIRLADFSAPETKLPSDVRAELV